VAKNLDRWVDRIESELLKRGGDARYRQHAIEWLDNVLRHFGWEIEALEGAAGKTVDDLDWDQSQALSSLDIFSLWPAMLLDRATETGDQEMINCYKSPIGSPGRDAWERAAAEVRVMVLSEFGLVGDLNLKVDSKRWGSWSCRPENPAYLARLRSRGLEPCPDSGKPGHWLDCPKCDGNGWSNIDGSPRGKHKHEQPTQAE